MNPGSLEESVCTPSDDHCAADLSQKAQVALGSSVLSRIFIGVVRFCTLIFVPSAVRKCMLIGWDRSADARRLAPTARTSSVARLDAASSVRPDILSKIMPSPAPAALATSPRSSMLTSAETPVSEPALISAGPSASARDSIESAATLTCPASVSMETSPKRPGCCDVLLSTFNAAFTASFSAVSASATAAAASSFRSSSSALS